MLILKAALFALLTAVFLNFAAGPSLDMIQKSTDADLAGLGMPESADALLPALPDADNAFYPLVRATMRFEGLGENASKATKPERRGQPMAEIASRDSFVSWAKDNQEALDALQAALDKPGYRPPVNPLTSENEKAVVIDGKPITLLWLVKQLIVPSNTLHLDGLRLAREGDAARSLARFRAALRLTGFYWRSLESAFDIEIANQSASQTYDSLGAALALGLWNSEDLAALQESLAGAEPPLEFSLVLKGEAFRQRLLGHIIQATLAPPKDIDPGIQNRLARKWVELGASRFALIYLRLAQMPTGTLLEMRRAFDSIAGQAQFEDRIFPTSIKLDLAKTREILTKDVLQGHENHATMRLIFALERYKAAHGAIPPTLAALTEAGFQVPTSEPFGGGSFIYAPHPDGSYDLTIDRPLPAQPES